MGMTKCERDALYEDYKEQRNESLMLGGEFPSFREWLGETTNDRRQQKSDLWSKRWNDDTQDLY